MAEYTIELEGRQGTLRIHCNGTSGCGLRQAEPCLVGCCVLIQITPQLRILVAVEAIDGRRASIAWRNSAARS